MMASLTAASHEVDIWNEMEADWQHAGELGGESCYRAKNNTKDVERSLSSDLQSTNHVVGAFTGQRAARGLILFWWDNAKILGRHYSDTATSFTHLEHYRQLEESWTHRKGSIWIKTAS